MPTIITTKHVDDILFASIRFWGQPDDIAPRFEQLRDQIQPYAAGRMIRLTHNHHPDKGWDIEIGVPVSQAVQTDTISTRILPGGPMLCATHTGSLDELPLARQQLIQFINEYAITIAEHPAYTMVLDDTSFEIRAPLLLPRWIEQMANGIEQIAGAEVRQAVMGNTDIAADLPATEKTRWAQELMQRLDAAIPGEAARRDILNQCGHIFPQERIDHLRAEYLRLGSIDALLETMGRDQSFYGGSFYARSYREGDAIIETKQPCDPDGYANATDSKEKRASYCFCPLIQVAIRNDIPMSNTYCHCGAGWFRQMWEGILDQQVWIEVRKTVLRGDDVCQFAVHLPEG